MIHRLARMYRSSALIQILVVKELKARYRRTVLGFLWSFVNPFVLMLTYVLVFSIYLRVQMDNFPVYLLCGILPWACFSGGMVEAMHSIINNAGLIKKVFLPSEILPLVNVLANAVHYVLSLPILFLFLVYFGSDWSWPLLAVPAILLIQLLFTYGLALIAASLAVQFRDLLYIVPNLLMIWMFMTPIIYPISIVPEKYRPLMESNPMSVLIGAYHAVFYYNVWPSWPHLAIMAGVALAALFAGLAFFEARKALFAEEI